jgi:hypothetical protein
MSGGQRYEAMMVEEYVDAQGQGRSKWTKIGAAFVNKDGSIGVQLAAFPMNGKIVLQVPLSKEEREAKFGVNQAQQRQPQGRPQQRGGGPQRGGYGNYGGRQPPSPQQQAAPPYAPPKDQGYPEAWDDVPPEGYTEGGGGFADE